MIQVAFAGHNRPNDLGRHESVIQGLNETFFMMKAAGVKNARLLTGLAPGADELAARCWRDADLGSIHAVFPFLDDENSVGVIESGLVESATWLDGASAEAAGRNPHLKQTRLIVETADMVVVVWTGGQARGAGGTADAVLSALELGLPVIWIQPSDPTPRLINPDSLPSDFHFPEFREALQTGRHVEPINLDRMRELMAFEADVEPPPPPPRTWRDDFDDWLHTWLWRTYAKFRKTLGGKVPPGPASPPLPVDLAEQPGFKVMSQALADADHTANRLSAVHRSEQLLLITAMILAAIVGSSPSMWPGLKLVAVCVELGLGIAALMVWASASDAQQHERWGEARYLAEQMRLERAGWCLGVSLVSTGVPPAERDESDLGRSIRRKSGLPSGKYDADRVAAWGAWAMDALIFEQAAYHRAISVRDHRVAHKIHLVEDLGFLILFVLLTAYITMYLAHIHLPEGAKKAVSGIVTMAGGIVPALGAASMALEAKLEFKEQSERSKRISQSLDDVAKMMSAAPNFDELQNTARAAMRLHILEARHWREGTGRRLLFRP